MTAFDRELTSGNLAANCVDDGVEPEASEVLVGLDYYEHKPVRVNFDRNRYIGIYGKRGFGKTNLLKVLLQGLREKYPECTFVFLDDGRQQLRRIMRRQFPSDKQEALRQTDLEMKKLSEKHMLIFGNEIYLRNLNQLRNFLFINGLTTKQPASVDRLNMQSLPTPPTKIVFVIDNKSAYPNVINDLHPVAQSVSDTGHIIILADVRPMEREYSDKLGRTMDVAFLLDNIGEFVADRGSKSVFGEMNEKELKMIYARCEIGDGYCYRIDSDELIKMKFLKADSQRTDKRVET